MLISKCSIILQKPFQFREEILGRSQGFCAVVIRNVKEPPTCSALAITHSIPVRQCRWMMHNSIAMAIQFEKFNVSSIHIQSFPHFFFSSFCITRIYFIRFCLQGQRVLYRKENVLSRHCARCMSSLFSRVFALSLFDPNLISICFQCRVPN